MAETIKGINVVIGAETTGLSKALSDVNKKSRDIQSELKQVEKLLKLDPGNTELLAQKQKLLADAVTQTSQKLNTLKTAQQQVNEQFAKGDISEGQYRAFQRELAKTEQDLKSLDGKLDETTDTLKKQGVTVSQLGKDYQESFDQAKQSIGNSFEQMKKVGAGVTALGAGIAAGLGVAVKGAADFEQGMANVYSVMAPDEVAQFSSELKNLAIVMGADTKYSATEAARGIEELVKAGVSTKDILNGGLQGALSLATAGELELADAAEIASTALNAFKDDHISVKHAADILAGAANASATSVMEMKMSLSQVASVASAVGMSFEDTSTALAVFAQNGLKGSDAGTSLKTMLSRLQPMTNDAYAAFNELGLMTLNVQEAMSFLADNGVKPASNSIEDVNNALEQYAAKTAHAKVGTAKANKAYKELALSNGILTSSFYDQTGSLKDLNQIADILQKSMTGLTDAQRQQYMYTLFGSDAIRASNILFKEGSKGVNDMAAAMKKISADDVAAQKMNTFKGTIEQLSGSLETAKISIGEALLPALRILAEAVQKVVDVFNRMPEGMKTFIAISGAVVAAIALITGPLLLLIGFIPQIVAGFTMLTPITGALGAAFTALTGPIGLVIAAVAALVAGLVYLYNNNETVREGLNTAWGAIRTTAVTIFNAIAEFIKRVFGDLQKWWQQWGGTVTGIFKDLFEILKIAFQAAFDAISSIVKTIFNSLKSFWDTWGKTITDLFTTVLNVVKTVFQGAWNSIKIIIETAIGVISGIIKTFLAVLKGDWSGAWEAVKGVAESIWNGIKAMFSNVGSMMMSIGKDIMQGLINGIKSMANAVWDSAKDVAAGIKDGFKDFFGIHSPSRLMTDYGEYISQGLANGISQAGQQAIKSAANVSAAVAGAMQYDFNGVSSAAYKALNGVQGQGSGSVTNQYNMNGLFNGASIVIRSDDDIRKLGQEFGNVIRGTSRGLGGVAT